MRASSSPASSASSRSRPASTSSPGSSRPAGTCVPALGMVAVVEDEQLLAPVALARHVREHAVGVPHACARGASPCARASQPGSARAPRRSRRLRASGGSGRAPAPPRRRSASRAPHRATSSSSRRSPGSAPIRCARSSPSVASVQTRSASPPYSSTIVAQSSWTRFAMLPGKRCTAGLLAERRLELAGSISAIAFGVERARAAPSSSAVRGTRSARCTCWSSANPISSASGSWAISRSASSLPVK